MFANAFSELFSLLQTSKGMNIFQNFYTSSSLVRLLAYLFCACFAKSKQKDETYTVRIYNLKTLKAYQTKLIKF